MTLKQIAGNLREHAQRYRREAAFLEAEARAIETVLKAAAQEGPEAVLQAIQGQEGEDDD